MRPLSPIAVLIFDLLAAPLCCAQAAATTAPPQTQTVLRSTTNMVLVDVVVTDHGQVIHGLDRNRFHIFENGHEQSIASFDEHVPTASPAIAPAPALLPPNVYTNVPAYPAGSAVNVLLLDMLNTSKPDQDSVQRQLIEYLDHRAPGSSLAIFMLGSQLKLLQGFTTDTAQLTKALQSPRAAPQTSLVLEQEKTSGELRDEADKVGTMSAVPAATLEKLASDMRQLAANITAEMADRRVPTTLDALQRLARYLNAIPGRKNLIWFSGSFPIELTPATFDPGFSTPEVPSEPGKMPVTLDPFRATRDYTDSVRQTSELLAASRVAVYTVHAAAQQSAIDSSRDQSSETGMGASRASRNDAMATARTIADQGSMRTIAEQTGGQYFDNYKLREAMDSAIENGSSYYTIGYVPAGKLDGKFRTIKLRLDDAKYNLAYRRGYYADPEDKPSVHRPGEITPLMASAMPGAPPATQIQFQARVLPASDPQLQGAKLPDGPAGDMAATLKAPVQRYIVDLMVDPHSLTFAEAPDGARQAAIEFVVTGFDADTKRVNYFDRTGQLSLSAERYAQLMTASLNERFALDLPSGQISLRIVVYDKASNRAGALEVPLDLSANESKRRE